MPDRAIGREAPTSNVVKWGEYVTNTPTEYMIIIYNDPCSFQRCGNPKETSGEYNYESLDELYKAQQVDGIVLERDWERVRDLECTDSDILGLWD